MTREDTINQTSNNTSLNLVGGPTATYSGNILFSYMKKNKEEQTDQRSEVIHRQGNRQTIKQTRKTIEKKGESSESYK